MRTLFVLIAVAILSGCVNLSTKVMPGHESFKQYKSAYIEVPNFDEFNMTSALMYELSDIGLQVMGKPFENPTEKDLLVKFTYSDSWDMAKYLKSFQIWFVNAKTGTILLNTSYESEGIWVGARDGRLQAAFNDIRSKLDYPPTKQFDR